VFAFLKANWFALCVPLVKSVDWSGIVARVFSYLLKRAASSGSYENVRTLARRVIEQGNYVLQVTDDGVITSTEAGQIVGTTRDLLNAWANGHGKGVTEAIEKGIKDAVSEVKGG
jgi:ribosomal protein S5